MIHTVGPVARGHVGDKEIKDLTSCYKNSLDLVKEYDLRTVVSTIFLIFTLVRETICLNSSEFKKHKK